MELATLKRSHTSTDIVDHMVRRRLIAIALCVSGVAVAGSVGSWRLLASPSVGQCRWPIYATEELKSKCYIRSVHRRVEREGIGAVEAIERQSTMDIDLARRCHWVMHLEGRPIGRRIATPAALRNAALTIDGRAGNCSSGALHGIFEGFVDQHGFKAIGSDSYQLLCSWRTPALQRIDCAHGLGHVIARETKLAYSPASRRCAEFPTPSDVDCLSAFVMTHAEGLKLKGGPMTHVTSAPALERYCSQFPQISADLCFRWFPLAARLANVISRSATAAVCDGARSWEHRTLCFVGIGRLSSQKLDSWSCDRLDRDGQRVPCLYGREVANVLFDASLTADRFSRHCATFHGRERPACYLALGRAQGLNDQPHASICDGLTADDRTWCKRGLTLRNEPIDRSPAELRELQHILE